MLILWGEFILCSAVIVVCGYFLSLYGDIIAEKSGLGRAWVGLILMAGVTSLPELISGISAVTIASVPDIAVGGIMGSCIFNISIIALMDFFHGRDPIFSRAATGHMLSAGFGVLLIGVASMSIIAGPAIPEFYHIGLYSPVILFIYIMAIRSVYYYEKRLLEAHVTEVAEAQEAQYDHMTLNKAILFYVINGGIIVIAATVLPFLGDRIAVATGLGGSFVGTVFIGLATSLPELAVSMSALKIGAAEMAIANLFGSNLFNIAIITVEDLFYTKGSLLGAVSSEHAVMGFIAMMMTGVAIVALTYRARKKFFLRLSWDAFALVLGYIISIILLYRMR
ncbi:MAG: sodium:calcium antiporter [Proteobacteria bacterium]|nr:sodium:calcium antiporter [Pseudomonadota bacterium]